MASRSTFYDIQDGRLWSYKFYEAPSGKHLRQVRRERWLEIAKRFWDRGGPVGGLWGFVDDEGCGWVKSRCYGPYARWAKG